MVGLKGLCCQCAFVAWLEIMVNPPAARHRNTIRICAAHHSHNQVSLLDHSASKPDIVLPDVNRSHVAAFRGRRPCAYSPRSACLGPIAAPTHHSSTRLGDCLRNTQTIRTTLRLSSGRRESWLLTVTSPILSLVNKNAIPGEIVLAATSPLW